MKRIESNKKKIKWKEKQVKKKTGKNENIKNAIFFKKRETNKKQKTWTNEKNQKKLNPEP